MKRCNYTWLHQGRKWHQRFLSDKHGALWETFDSAAIAFLSSVVFDRENMGPFHAFREPIWKLHVVP